MNKGAIKVFDEINEHRTISDIVQKNKVWIALVCLMSVYIVAIHVLFCVSWLKIAVFIGALFFSIVVPGLAFVSFLGIKLSRLELFFASFLSGHALIVIEYFLSEIFNRSLSFKATNLLTFSIATVYLVYKKYKTKIFVDICDKTNDWLGLSVLTVFGVFNVFGYVANNLGPDVVPVCLISRDMQYWINNTVALKIAWPPNDLSMVGYELNYHYFSNIPIAFISDVYSIDVFSMSFVFYALIKTIVLVGATQILLSVLTSNKILQLVGYILLIFSTGAESISLNTFVAHILIAPFGFDISFAYGALFVSFLIMQWKTDVFSHKLLIGALLAWGMCVGSKAPVASTLIFIPAMMCFIWLCQKRFSKAFGYGLSILAIYMVICKYCVGLFKVMSGDSKWQMSGFYEADHYKQLGDVEYWDILGQNLVGLGHKSVAVGLIIRIICLNPALTIGSIVAITYLIKSWRHKDIEHSKLLLDITMIISALVGIVLGISFEAGGKSEIYFAMAAYIPMTILVLTGIKNMCDRSSERLRIKELSLIKRLGIAICSFLMILGVLRFLWSGAYGVGAFRSVIGGINNLQAVKNNMADYNADEKLPIGIRKTDVEALTWISENAPADAVILSDKAIMSNQKSYYMYGIFSERQQYLEGIDMYKKAGETVQKEIVRRSEMIKNVFNNTEGAIDDIKAEGVNYIVQTIDISPNLIYKNNDLELVKSTKTMNVYKIK